MVRCVAGGLISGNVRPDFAAHSPHRVEKFLRRHVCRTGSTPPKSRRAPDADAQPRQPLISANCSARSDLAFGERRRVENDQVKPSRASFSPSHSNVSACTSHEGIARRRDRLVQAKISLCAGERVRADIEIRHRPRATARRIKRKAAGETEGIQNRPARRQ